MFLAVLNPDSSNPKVFIEENAETVAVNLEAAVPDLEYYHISVVGQGNVTIQPVNVKAGPRTSAPAREIVEIEAGGQDVGSAIVEV